MGRPLFPRVAVVGGAGYVGSALVPFLLDRGYQVKVIDLFLYGTDVFNGRGNDKNLTQTSLDIRKGKELAEALKGMDAVVHLACVSNDPSFELNPALGKSINYDAFFGLLKAVRDNGVKRFIYASSSSVYGVREDPDVREETPCAPLTDYSKYKLLCEEVLRREGTGKGDWVILRPATVCGWAPRLRLDLTVNILTIHALVKKQITVFGGNQLRPNINMKDIVEAYRLLLESPAEKIRGEVFNAGYDNMSVMKIAELVRETLNDPGISLKVEPTNDPRSYHVNSDKIARVLGFRARHDLRDAIQGLADAYRAGKITDPLNNPLYYNIKTMQNKKLEETLHA